MESRSFFFLVAQLRLVIYPMIYKVLASSQVAPPT